MLELTILLNSLKNIFSTINYVIDKERSVYSTSLDKTQHAPVVLYYSKKNNEVTLVSFNIMTRSRATYKILKKYTVKHYLDHCQFF